MCHKSRRKDITRKQDPGNAEMSLTVGEDATDIEEMLGILRDGIRQLSAAASEGRNLPLQTRMILRLQASRTAERCCRLMHRIRSEEHTSELQSLMRISYAVFCLKKKKHRKLLPH